MSGAFGRKAGRGIDCCHGHVLVRGINTGAFQSAAGWSACCDFGSSAVQMLTDEEIKQKQASLMRIGFIIFIHHRRLWLRLAKLNIKADFLRFLFKNAVLPL